MEKIYILQYADGSYNCQHSVSYGGKTLKIGLARQITDLQFALTLAQFHNCEVMELVVMPVNVLSS